MKKYTLLFGLIAFWGQLVVAQITIRGVVKDDKGLPVIGATALVKSTIGITDIKAKELCDVE